MPVPDRPRRGRRRFAGLSAACGLLGALTLGMPSSASAYEEHFCQYVVLPSGANCYAQNRRALLHVYGWSYGSNDRVCAASFTSPWGSQNSAWRCDYSYVDKFLGGLQGVGAIHNGDPQAFTAYGAQEY